MHHYGVSSLNEARTVFEIESAIDDSKWYRTNV